MQHWKVILEHYGERDRGDVVTKDGEVIGTWSADENDFCSFTPYGEQQPIFVNPFPGLLCDQIVEWHEAQRQIRGA
ncbi:MAG: hypothetical protein Q4G24_14845 [Paracoccus sp. (in: a-proteobacteria)]|uniref:hypothetical protein n=1 Tax=Paracoccus sp. TaxID=267 RepID=UPI0026E0977F|nr:hypothetical protein [Paracoccus sp. (in: a-proteobacteria)]MDO5622731.1 hypothetical protein [Paracoccus sp. (in: a-proteobacteria)]